MLIHTSTVIDNSELYINKNRAYDVPDLLGEVTPEAPESLRFDFGGDFDFPFGDFDFDLRSVDRDRRVLPVAESPLSTLTGLLSAMMGESSTGANTLSSLGFGALCSATANRESRL